MISINQVKNGMALKVDGQIFTIADFQHVKPGKGSAFVKIKLRNIKLGTVIERTYRSSEKLEDLFIEQKPFQFLYRTGNHFHFMDQESFEEVVADEEVLGHAAEFLKEGSGVKGSLYEGQMISIEMPIFVELKIAHTEPGIKGDTAKSGTKPATVETGAVVQVPLFLNTGDVIRVDTRSETYIGRV